MHCTCGCQLLPSLEHDIIMAKDPFCHDLIRRMRKLMYRVVFPFELKLRNTTDDCPNADDLYNLFAVVVHVGAGPNHGKALCCHLCTEECADLPMQPAALAYCDPAGTSRLRLS